MLRIILIGIYFINTKIENYRAILRKESVVIPFTNGISQYDFGENVILLSAYTVANYNSIGYGRINGFRVWGLNYGGATQNVSADLIYVKL